MTRQNDMIHTEVDALLADYIGSDLENGKQTLVEQHLQQCTECQRTFAELQHVRQLLELLAVPVQKKTDRLKGNSVLSLADEVLASLNEPIPLELMTETMPTIKAYGTERDQSPTEVVHLQPGSQGMLRENHTLNEATYRHNHQNHSNHNNRQENTFIIRGEEKRNNAIAPGFVIDYRQAKERQQAKKSHSQSYVRVGILVATILLVLLASSVFAYANYMGVGVLGRPEHNNNNVTPAQLNATASATATHNKPGVGQTAISSTATPAPGSSIAPGGNTTVPSSTAPTTVVISTANSKTLQATISIEAVPNPDASKYQVQSSSVHATNQPQSTTINATGKGYTAGTPSRGTLLITNLSQVRTFNIGKGGILSRNSYSVTLDDAVSIPAAPANSNASNAPSQVVHAEYEVVGTVGNIAAHAFNSSFACDPKSDTDCYIIDNNSVFTGGTDVQGYTQVQQSDIDNVTQAVATQHPAPIGSQLTQLIQSQLPANEHLLPGGSSSCKSSVTVNHAANDQATTVTGTITYTCTMQAYDYSGALAMATRWLSVQAASQFGSSYILTGNISATLVKEVVINASQNWAVADIAVSGTWQRH